MQKATEFVTLEEMRSFIEREIKSPVQLLRNTGGVVPFVVFSRTGFAVKDLLYTKLSKDVSEVEFTFTDTSLVNRDNDFDLLGVFFDKQLTPDGEGINLLHVHELSLFLPSGEVTDDTIARIWLGV